MDGAHPIVSGRSKCLLSGCKGGDSTLSLDSVSEANLAS